MLVLSRRPCESIVFPELNISLTAVSVRGQVVRIGIEAPPCVSVFREEVLHPTYHEQSLGTRHEAFPPGKGASSGLTCTEIGVTRIDRQSPSIRAVEGT